MPTQTDTREVYRLVIQHRQGEAVYTPLFTSRKQAIACVAEAARHARHAGRPVGIVLERAQPPRNGSGIAVRRSPLTADRQYWTPVECWDANVILRILQQSGDMPGVEIAKPDVAPPADPPALAATYDSAVGDQGAVIVASAEIPATAELPSCSWRSKITGGHRWHVALIVSLTIITWTTITLLLTGGRLLSPMLHSPEALVNNLPLAAPGAHENARDRPPVAFTPGLLRPTDSRPTEATDHEPARQAH